MARPTLEGPPVAASKGVKVGAQSLAVDVFGSHGGNAGRPVLLPGSVPAPGSGTRHDARMRPDVSEECGSLLQMWRDVVRSLPVDDAVYEPILCALSINAIVCKYMELVAVLGSALLQKCRGDVANLVSAVESPFFYATHRRGSCSALVW